MVGLPLSLKAKRQNWRSPGPFLMKGFGTIDKIESRYPAIPHEECRVVVIPVRRNGKKLTVDFDERGIGFSGRQFH